MLKDDRADVRADQNGVVPEVPSPPEPAPAANPADPLGVGAASAEVWRSLLAHPEAIMEAQRKLAGAWMGVVANAVSGQGAQTKPVIEPAKGDHRWKHPAWTGNPMLDAIKQSYLISAKAAFDAIDSAQGVDDETKHRVKFFTKQFIDAMSPTNSPFLNPAVVEATLATGGANLRKGFQHLADDLQENKGRVKLVERSGFEVGKNIATTPGAVVYRNELIELIQYNPTAQTVFERPLLIVPPWINKFYILDLQPSNSFIKYSLDGGLQTFVISWRNPDRSMANLSMEDYMELGPLAAARAVSAITGQPSTNIIGYCIGGTLTAMLLAYLARTGELLIDAVTLFTALIDFADVGDIRAFLSPEAISMIESKMADKGYLDGEEMADTFTMLRDVDLIWTPAVNRYLLGQDAPAFDLLYWNSDATRLPRAMHEWYLKNLYLENNLSRPGKLKVKGVPLDLGAIQNDVYDVSTMEDHIAPWRSTYKATQLFGGSVAYRLGHSGHIAGIVNPPAKGKGNWWSNEANPPSPDEWLGGATKHDGSWWPDWLSWIAARSGERREAPGTLGSEHFPPLCSAPGTYVLAKKED
jgi:polyhydroxyalkanoate synthase